VAHVKSNKQWTDIISNPQLIENLKIQGFAHPSKIQFQTITEMSRSSNKNWALTA
jgi:hypothetical protein